MRMSDKTGKRIRIAAIVVAVYLVGLMAWPRSWSAEYSIFAATPFMPGSGWYELQAKRIDTKVTHYYRYVTDKDYRYRYDWLQAQLAALPTIEELRENPELFTFHVHLESGEVEVVIDEAAGPEVIQ